MVQSETKVISSLSDLNDMFEHKGDRTGIRPTFVKPKIGEKGKTIIVINSDDKKGNIGPIRMVTNPKMNNGLPTAFMDVMDYEDQTTIYQMGLGKSLPIQFDALCNDNNWTLAELHGKIVTMKASPYGKYPCRSCGGKGCDDCSNTGKSTVFSLTARMDLMSPTGQTKKKVADEF